MDTKEAKDLRHFNHWSATYETSLGQRFLFDPVHHAVLNLIERSFNPRVILDTGCGTGRLLRDAAARWPSAHLVGIDPAYGMLAVGRRLAPQNRYSMAFAEALPLAPASVDLVISTISFHHWSDGPAGIRNVARVLRPGGFFLLADVRPPSWFIGLTNHFGHDQVYGPDILRAYFTQAGLQVANQRWIRFHTVLVTVGKRIQ
jgi:ubiquinone/menaquinone biosynthesis C-methylase UbiE